MFEGFNLTTVQAGEVSIRARIGGSGPPLLLLHGNPQTHVMWHKVAPQLARAFTVIATDLTGYGKSSKPPSSPRHEAYSKRAMARDQVEVMHKLGFSRFAVAGHDRGGRVGYRMALDFPDVVQRLAFQVAQDPDGTVQGRHALELGIQAGHFRTRLWRGTGGDEVRVVRQRIEAQERPQPPPSEPPHRAAHTDAREPALDRARVTDLQKPAMGLQKHVLDEIVELVVAPQQPQADARHVGRVAPEQGIEVGRARFAELSRSPALHHPKVRAAARLVPFMRRHAIDQSFHPSVGWTEQIGSHRAQLPRGRN